MKSFSKIFSAITLSSVMLITTFNTAGALPLPVVKAPQVSDVSEVQYRRGWRDRRGWHNGHRGYRTHRPGYRRYNGFWFPLAAFGAGAVIGGAIQSPRVYRGSSAHVRWCSARYRTYRAFDNTYVPRVGVRAQCNSPYN